MKDAGQGDQFVFFFYIYNVLGMERVFFCILLTASSCRDIFVYWLDVMLGI